MKQFQINYEGKDKFASNIKKIKSWCSSSVFSKVLFQIYTESLDHQLVSDICKEIKSEIPEALYMGCSTNGNIVMGEYNGTPVAVICTIYEYPTTNVEVFQYHLDSSVEKKVTNEIVNEVEARPWVKAIILNTTMRGMSMSDFCEDLKILPRDIALFGGGAFSEDMNEDAAFVFSSVGEISDDAIVLAFIGGDDYYVKTTHITGWRPLGRELHVTKAEGPILYELDNKPAYETYYKYLNIKNDDNFFINTLEFPFFYEHNGINILRAPVTSRDDGALVMTADIDEDVMARMAYGDPWTILDSVYQGALTLQDFAPETITIFSCAARRTFWGADEISNESLPFQSLAPTSGFYTSGEFVRNGLDVNQHNVTLVLGAQREGDINPSNIKKVEMNTEGFSGKVSMISRLATFIQAATDELEDANRQLERAAISDALTSLFNRGEIQRRITRKAKELEKSGSHFKAKAGVSLIMMDIDDFKSVNDTYGHKEGDIVLKMLSDMLKRTIDERLPGCLAGRWGGEEFMVLLPKANEQMAVKLAETFRVRFSELEFPNANHRTISLGVTELIAGEDADIACMRVDDALYEAKKTGKNKVIVH